MSFPFQTREQEELEEALEVERQENEQRRLLIQKEEQLQQMLKRKNKQALLDDLVSSKTRAKSKYFDIISAVVDCVQLTHLSLLVSLPCVFCGTVLSLQCYKQLWYW